MMSPSEDKTLTARLSPTQSFFEAAERRLPIEVRRHGRARRMSIRLDPGRGAVILTLPPRAKLEAGLRFLEENRQWVIDRIDSIPQPGGLGPGSEIPLRGVACRIERAERVRGLAWHQDGVLWVGGEAPHLNRRIRDFFKREAHRDFTDLCLPMAQSIGAKVARISIRDGVSRWGSCSPRGVLSFSWRLVMAPPFVAHYLAAHEVAHLRHMNHSPKFWTLVDELTPHRAQAQAWLKAHGAGLHRYGL